MSMIIEFKLDFDHDLDAFLQSQYPQYVDYRILSKSLDARGAPRGKKPIFLYKIEAIKTGENFSYQKEVFEKKSLNSKPIIVGAGPGGLFCALRLIEYGIPSIIIERGEQANKRMLHISRYWRKGILNEESNVCFGEGGAGLFSDGKLITRVKSPYISYVMQRFVDFGAPEETAYISNPHLGSNKIRNIISKISEFLIQNGCEFRYNQKVTDFLMQKDRCYGVVLDEQEKLESEHVVLATGHSGKEIYQKLLDHQVEMKPKDFAVGVRIEHPRKVIDHIQHGKYANELGSARYRLSYHNKESNKGTYSFCMCPGGYVLSSGTDKEGLVVNGMSNYARNSPWSNSALVVTVHAGVDYESTDVLAGLHFQEEIESKAYQLSQRMASGRELPAMTLGEFLKGKLNDKELPKTSSPSGIFKADIRKLFPSFIVKHLERALVEFDRKLKGFKLDDALLIAPETRTSAPVTILRDKATLMSLSHQGFYPCGEGAGYAGGITSAAADGISIAESIVKGAR